MNALGKAGRILHSAFPKVMFSFLKTSSASFKTSSANFWKPAQPVLDQPIQFLKTSSAGFFLGPLFYPANEKVGFSFWKPAQPVLAPVHPPTQPTTKPKNRLAETGSAGFRIGSTGSQSEKSNGYHLLGILYIPVCPLSSFTLAHPRILGWPTLKQEHSIHLSHPKSHSLQSFGGPLVWGEVCLTHWWFHLYSPFLFISWAHCKLESRANLLHLEPCVPWRIEVAWESPNLWTTPRSLYHPLVELS
jgi:hypothetical protein